MTTDPSRRRFLAMAAALGAAMTVVGCGSEIETPAAPPPPDSKTPPGPPTAFQRSGPKK